MIGTVPFSLDLWRDVVLQPEQAPNDEALRALEGGPSWSFVDATGHCIACGCLFPASEHIAVAVAYIGADAGPAMPALFLKARKILKEAHARWPIIRAGVLEGFTAGERLIELLGFKPMGLSVPSADGARVIQVFQLTARGH